jgi:hypothetical protein
VETLFWLGKASLQLKLPAIAIVHFEQALKAYPSHVPSLKGLAEARKRMN